ncbi:hypothetical protein PTKIN_Ptkin06aG0067400 [Pterospermum kingtungense]
MSWLPMYDELKLTLLIYLWFPKTKGTSYVYETLLRPYMTRNETEMDRKIQEFRARAWDFALYYWQNCTEMGQTKIFEMIQYLFGQSSRIKYGKQKSDGKIPGVPRSGKGKDWIYVEPPMSKLAQFQPDSQSEYDQGYDYSVPDSTSKSKHQQGRFKLFRGK